MKKMILAAVFCFVASSSFAASIRMDGYSCEQESILNDTSITSTKLQSKFVVTSALSDSVYQLRLIGGLPRFDSGGNVCIDTFLGHNAKFPSDFNGTISLPEKSFYADGVGYFNGNELIIMINYIRSSLTGFSDTKYPYSFLSSAFMTLSHVLVFQYAPQNGGFILHKWIFRSSTAGAGGYTASPGLYMEDVRPDKEATVIKNENNNLVYTIVP